MLKGLGGALAQSPRRIPRASCASFSHCNLLHNSNFIEFSGQKFLFRRATVCRVAEQPDHPGARSEKALRSLDRLLSSEDSIDEGSDLRDAEGPSTRLKRPDAAEQRVRPLYVYVIYYCFIVVYLSTAWLQATDGDFAASILVDGLSNDHLAVQSGQVPRLATAGFVCDGPLELFTVLTTLLTVGAEAEALLGYSLFWAVYWLASLTGALADAVLSELPVTAGPANAVAGLVGGLLSYYVANGGLEERIKAAREEARASSRKRLMGIGAREEEAGAAGGKGQRPELEEAEAEVEILPFWSVKLEASMSPTAKAALSVLSALVVAAQGLIELGGAASNASWIGVAASFWAGGFLVYGAGPRYDVQNASEAGTEAGAEAGGGGGTSWQRRLGGGGSSRGAKAEEGGADADGLMVVDVTSLAQRRLVVGGYLTTLGAGICGWLAWLGTDF